MVLEKKIKVLIYENPFFKKVQLNDQGFFSMLLVARASGI